MYEKDYIAFIVEGRVREPVIIENIKKVFFKHRNFKILTLSAEQNIYMLWKKWKEDDFETDILELLKEDNTDIKEQLTDMDRDDFSEIYLFFDYDGHQNNLGADDDDNALEQMLESFDNETENGKLYISYPMVEALRDFSVGTCKAKSNCFVSIDAFEHYKEYSAVNTEYTQFKKYDFEVWQDIMDIFSMRLSCLMNDSEILNYIEYIQTINPYAIYRLEKDIMIRNKIFVLSAFPEFLLDYFGKNLWVKCVRHAKNQRESCEPLKAYRNKVIL